MRRLPSRWRPARGLVVTTASPLGSLGAIGYSQYDVPALAQLASAARLWGIALLVYWFAAVVNLAWERSFDWRS